MVFDGFYDPLETRILTCGLPWKIRIILFAAEKGWRSILTYTRWSGSEHRSMDERGA
jgi:hypothetical protein